MIPSEIEALERVLKLLKDQKNLTVQTRKDIKTLKCTLAYWKCVHTKLYKSIGLIGGMETKL